MIDATLSYVRLRELTGLGRARLSEATS